MLQVAMELRNKIYQYLLYDFERERGQERKGFQKVPNLAYILRLP
jgi:hypothetical protein